MPMQSLWMLAFPRLISTSVTHHCHSPHPHHYPATHHLTTTFLCYCLPILMKFCHPFMVPATFHSLQNPIHQMRLPTVTIASTDFQQLMWSLNTLQTWSLNILRQAHLMASESPMFSLLAQTLMLTMTAHRACASTHSETSTADARASSVTWFWMTLVHPFFVITYIHCVSISSLLHQLHADNSL